jgi:hypothetical protein
MPDVMVAGAAVQRVLEVGSGLTAEGASGVALAGTRGGVQTWKGHDTEWGLRVTPQSGHRSAPVQVLLAQMRASVPDGRRWLYEGTWWLRHEGPTELGIRWPAAVEAAGVTIDGAPVTAIRPEAGRLWLPLAGPGGARRVRIRWRHEPGKEALDRPILDLPDLEGAVTGPTVWTVDVPAGWDVPVGGLTGATRRAAVELYRAAAELAFCRELGGPVSASEAALAQAQARLRRGLVLAGLAVAAGADARRRVGPDGLDLAAWLKQLRQQSEGPAGDEVAEPDADETGEGVPGTPVSWVSQRERRAPQVRLMPAQERRLREAVAHSGQWLVALLVVWTVTLSGVLRRLARWLWPEAALLLGALGWQLAGPTVIVLFLAALGVCGRLVLAGGGLRRMLRR